MAYFGRKPRKPGSTPGAGSGQTEQDRQAHRRAVVQRLQRRLSDGRPDRAGRQGRNIRNARSAR